MKFEIAGSVIKEEKLVKLSLESSPQGDITLYANDEVILWLNSDGTILLNSASSEALGAMGFKISPNKSVVI